MENIALTLENVTGKGLGFKLKDISAKFENGYIYAIIGKNGAGKTTLFNYILAQRKRYTGSIKMSGYELERNHAKAMEIIGFVSEDNVFFIISVMSCVVIITQHSCAISSLNMSNNSILNTASMPAVASSRRYSLL